MRKALIYFGCGVLGTAVSAASAAAIKLGIMPGYAQITPVVYWSIAAVVAIINLAFTSASMPSALHTQFQRI